MSNLKTRFGTLDYNEEDIVTLSDGLVGFPAHTRFLLLEHKPGSPFRWLQSIDEAGVAFLVANPSHYLPNYELVLGDAHVARLSLTPETPTLVFTTATIPHGRPNDLTLNLAGPIVINVETRTGRQIVLENEAYTTQHRVFPKADLHDSDVAA